MSSITGIHPGHAEGLPSKPLNAKQVLTPQLGVRDNRYHESLGNVTPADAYFGLDGAILSERRKTKEKTMKQRRLINQKRAA